MYTSSYNIKQLCILPMNCIFMLRTIVTIKTNLQVGLIRLAIGVCDAGT